MKASLSVVVSHFLIVMFLFLSGCQKEGTGFGVNEETPNSEKEGVLEVYDPTDDHFTITVSGNQSHVKQETEEDFLHLFFVDFPKNAMSDHENEAFDAYLDDAAHRGFEADEHRALYTVQQRIMDAINHRLLVDMAAEKQLILKELPAPNGISVESDFLQVDRGLGVYTYRVLQTIEHPNCDERQRHCLLSADVNVSFTFSDGVGALSKNTESNIYYLKTSNVTVDLDTFTLKSDRTLLNLSSVRGPALSVANLDIELILDESDTLTSFDVAMTDVNVDVDVQFKVAQQQGKAGWQAFELTTAVLGYMSNVDMSADASYELVETSLRHLDVLMIYSKEVSEWEEEYVTLENCDPENLAFDNRLSIVSLTCSELNDPSGVQQLIALNLLSVKGGSVEEVDLSGLSNLAVLRLTSGSISALKLPHNSSLGRIHIEREKLTELDLSLQKHLEYLTIIDTPVEGLTLPSVTEMELLHGKGLLAEESPVSFLSNYLASLDIVGTDIRKIDLLQSKLLRTLHLESNALSSLDLSNNTSLYELSAKGNMLEAIDLSGLRALSSVNLSDNKLTQVNFGQNASLSTFDASNNQLVNLDFIDAPSLSTVYVNSNSLQSADVSMLGGLSRLNADDNQLTVIDVSSSLSLSLLSLKNNQLTSIDVTGNPELLTLDVTGNNISDVNMRFDARVSLSIDESDLSDTLFNTIRLIPKSRLNGVGSQQADDLPMVDLALACSLTLRNVLDPETVTHLICNNLEEDYDYSVLTSLESFEAKGTATIESLDLSSNLSLKTIDIDRGDLLSLVLPQTSSLESLRVYFNPELESIDLTVVPNLKSLELLYLWPMETIDVSKNTMLEEVWLEGLAFSSLDLSSNSNLKSLVINEIYTDELVLDLSNNVLLSEFSFGSTPINELDLSANINLMSIYYSSYNGLLCDDVVLPPTKVSFECADPFVSSK